MAEQTDMVERRDNNLVEGFCQGVEAVDQIDQTGTVQRLLQQHEVHFIVEQLTPVSH